MHKKKEPDFGGKTVIDHFPHCDSRVLHAPGECIFCDEHRDWQELRRAWGIAFTDWTPDEGEVACPSERARPLELIERCPGNRPREEQTR